MVDNLTWSASGRLLAAGTYGTSMKDFLAGHFSQNPRLGIPSRVLAVDPETLATEELIDYGPDTFGAATPRCRSAARYGWAPPVTRDLPGFVSQARGGTNASARRGFQHRVCEVSRTQLLTLRKDSIPVIVLGVILILVGYLLPVPAIIATIGWILLVIGVVLLILGQVGRPVGGRKVWF